MVIFDRGKLVTFHMTNSAFLIRLQIIKFARIALKDERTD